MQNMKSLVTKAKLHKSLLTSLLVITLILTACNKNEVTPVVSQPSETKKNSNRENETKVINEVKYEDKIKEGIDFLKGQGLNPSKVLDEGSDSIVTWEDLCKSTNAILLNVFLENKLSNTSASKNYTPVKLKSIIIELEDNNNLAKVYFYEDKLIGGVTYPKEDHNLDNKRYRSLKGETLEEIRNINFPIWKGEQVNKPAIYYLNVKSAKKDGFERATQIEPLDKGRYLIVYDNKSESRVYIYDTKDASDSYTGISLKGEHRLIRVKNLEGNKTAICLPERVRIVDTETFKTIEEFTYPKDMVLNYDDLDISIDGKTIAYIGQQGLVVADKSFGNSKVLVKSKLGKTPNGQDSEAPRYPKFSPDSSRILYNYCGYEWILGNGVVTVDGSKNSFFSVKDTKDERTYTEWFDSNHIYSRAQAYSETGNPVILNVNTGEKTSLVKEILKNKLINYASGEKALFYHSSESAESDVLEFGYYNLASNSYHKILNVQSSKNIMLPWNFYDRKNNAFIFIINNYPISSSPAILVGIDKG